MKNKLNQINQFNGGMIKDIEPLMVPNTVMTDCLNGTLITYNGNEFALQNDMGNYGFKNGALSNGFVPVGMKEHQGVLYIISYNPIDDKVEIGSFPSQQTIFTPIVDNKDATIEDIIIDKTSLYKDLEGETKIILLSKDPNFYLNPGDKYLLIYENSGEYSFKEALEQLNNKYYRHLVPYILTDENKLYNIDGLLELQVDKSTTNRSDWIPVSWDIPGWLAVKFSITVPEQFNIYFDKSKTYVDDSDSNAIKVYPGGDLRVQTYWNLVNYADGDLDKIKNNLVYFLHDYDTLDEKNISKLSPISLEPNQLISYNNFQSIIFNTIDAKTLGNYKYITPALLVENKDKKNYIIYSQFTQTISRDPITIDPNEIHFGRNYFKYFVGDNSLTMLTSWESFPGVSLEYKLERYSTSDSDNPYTAIDWTSVSDIISNGTIIIDIPFSENNEDIAEYDTTQTGEPKIKKVNFNKEDIYFLSLRYVINIESGNPITGDIEPAEDRIYATELVNRWYYVKDNFKDITGQNLVNYFADYIKLELNSGNYAFTETAFLKRRGNEDSKDEKINNYSFDSSDYFSEIKLVYPEPPGETYDTSKIGIKTIFKQGNTYSIKKVGNSEVYTISVPKDQNGDDGRLWRWITSKGVTVNNGKAIDSKGNTYTLLFNKIDGSFSFDLFNTFTVTNTEYNIVKEISSNDKYLYEYHPIGKTKTKVTDKNDTHTIEYRPEYVEFRKDGSGRDKWSMCFWWKEVGPFTIRFENNKLYYGENTEEFTPEKNWPSVLGDLNISSGTNWHRTDWKPNGHSATSTKSYADDYGFNIYNFYNAKYGNDSSHSGDSGFFGRYGSANNFCLAMSYETKNSWPCIYYCANKAPSNSKEDTSYISKTCIYSYLMMIYCLRYCMSSKNNIIYYSLYNYGESLINPVYIKTINLSGTYDWKYFMDERVDIPDEIDLIFNGVSFADNNVISTNTNVNFNCIVTPDESFKYELQRLIDNKNSNVRIKVDELERQPNIKSGDLYLIHEYNENANKVKLTNAIKSMVFTDQVRSNMDATLELFMRETDNNTRSVAREFISNIYDDGQ